MRTEFSPRAVVHYGIVALTLILCAVAAYHEGSLAPFAVCALVAAYQPPPLKPGEVYVDRPGPQPFYEATYIQNLDGMTTRDYMKYFKDGIKFARDHKRADTRIWGPGTTIAAGNNDFFQVQVGQDENSLDGATVITKTDYHTNMQEGAKIEKGASLIIDSLQLEVTISHREYNTFSADLTPTTAVVSATDTSSATNHMLLIDRACVFEFWRGNKLLAEGTLSDFPSEGGFFASFGGSTPEGFIQNGFGVAAHLREIVVLDAGYLFKVRMRTLVPITNVINVEIRAKLAGLLVETVP